MPHVNKQMISFFLTTKCNLRCVYCYNSKERAQLKELTLPLEVAKAGIDWYFSTNPSRHIRFYGPGEPTQMFSSLQQITAYAKQVGGEAVTAEIQTNGVFGKTVREWLLDNMNIIWMSFDGEPEIQNANRPLAGGHASAPIIEDNVRWFNENKGDRNLMVGARVTITDKNISRQKQLIDYFASIGITHIWNDPLFPTVDTVPVCDDEQKRNTFAFDMDKYVEEYIEAHQYAESKGIFYTSFLACNFDGVTNQHCRACTPSPHLTPDGYLSACDMVTFGQNAHHMDCFVFGKWNPDTKSFDLNETKLTALRNRSTENMPHCKKCPAKEHCGGYCLGEVVNETGSLLGQKPKTCRAICKLYSVFGSQPDQHSYLHP